MDVLDYLVLLLFGEDEEVMLEGPVILELYPGGRLEGLEFRGRVLRARRKRLCGLAVGKVMTAFSFERMSRPRRGTGQVITKKEWVNGVELYEHMSGGVW